MSADGVPGIRGGGRIVVLTGAGVSKESGLDTFRDAGGIWSRVRIEDVATPEAFARDPARVQAFYNARRRALCDAAAAVAPNAAHRALADLERRWPGEMLLVTQNVDDLHERAGSRNLVHMHGELLKARCVACARVVAWRDDLDATTLCAGCGAILRPHVVWFGEMPLEMERIGAALSACDLFVAIGTSGTVHPAAGFAEEARFGAGAHTVELNLEPSEGGHSRFAERILGPASRTVPAFVERLLSGGA